MFGRRRRSPTSNRYGTSSLGNSPLYAAIVVARLIVAVDRVRDLPESGRIVPELQRPDVREVIQGAYRIVYRLHEDREVAEVLTVFRGSRRFPELDLTDPQ